MPIRSETLDLHLANFLERMIRKDNTVIIVRGDHGLQGGPSVLEYSTQQVGTFYPNPNLIFDLHPNFNRNPGTLNPRSIAGHG